MRGVDTNILVRYLVEDDEGQAARVQRFLTASRFSDEPVFVSCIALCETVWVLQTVHGFRKLEALSQIGNVLETDIFRIEEEGAVRRALKAAREGRGDFADYLMGQLNLDRGCRVTVTFDRALRSDPAFSVL